MLPAYDKSGSNIIGTLFTGIEDVRPETVFNIYPNPVKSRFSIQLGAEAEKEKNEFRLIGNDGSLVGVFSDVISLEHAGNELKEGAYIVQLINAKGTSYRRFIKLN